MSSSESESDYEDVSTSLKNLRGSLKNLDKELEESIECLMKFRKEVKKIEKETQPIHLNTEYPLLHKYLPIWKKEKRLNSNGSKVFLNKIEANVFHLEEGWNSVYELCKNLKID